MIQPISGNIRDVAVGNPSLLAAIVGARLTGRLRLMIECDDEQPREEILAFRAGALVGSGDPGTVLATAVRALCEPFGLFDWEDDVPGVVNPAPAQVAPLQLLLAYGRQVTDPGEILARLVDESHVLGLSRNMDAIKAELKIEPAEWKILFRVNNRRTVAEVRELLALPTEEFDRRLLTCLLVGAISRRDPGTISSMSALSTGPSSVTGSVPGATSSSYIPTAPIPQSRPADTLPPAPGVPTPVPTDARPRVLVVDDSRTIQRMVQNALESLGLTLAMADDGEEAMVDIEKSPPDLVILDVIMPKMDGYRVCTLMRKSFGPRKVPIIMLTAKDGTFNMLKGKMAGATDYMTKPFEPEVLRRVVREHLGLPQD